VYLDAKFAFRVTGSCVVIDDHAHDVTVEDMDLRAAADDEVILVPVAAADEGGEFFRVADRTDDFGLLAWADAGNLAAEALNVRPRSS